MNGDENKVKQDKRKKLFFELLRYCVAGGVAFLFDSGTLYLFNSVILPPMGNVAVFGAAEDSIFYWDVRLAIATTMGFIVGIIVNYLISIFFVFTGETQKAKGRSVKAFVIFAVVGFIGYLLTVAGVQLGCAIFGITTDKAAPNYDGFGLLMVRAVVAGIVMIWNYVGRKVLVYKGE